MKCISLWTLMLSFLLAGAGCSGPVKQREGPADAVAEIRKLGGQVTVDEKAFGKPIIAVNLSDVAITDAALVDLDGLPHLQKLDIGQTRKRDHKTVTDAGLTHVEGLKELRRLSLKNTDVTDAGLERLRGLARLESLNLEGTKVTDAGLKYLSGFSKLQTLKLSETAVTEEGVAELQKSLPKCKITF